ncbi:MAG: outer membrane protein assembly factor BamD [Desulfovermiculus sp.]|nr:outer membrane protein assembly factor BamD [Desulfovermiculus sp.]
MNRRWFGPWFLTLVLSLGLLSGCGVIDTVFLKPPQDTALELLQAGDAAMQEDSYGQAIKYYTKLKDRYPFSPYTAQAELGLADAYFQDREYVAAENTYKEFESLHPGHENIPYVLFRIGLSNFKQFKSIDLPPANVSEALQYFNRVAETYPQRPIADQAREYAQKCLRFQAEHEIFVADFYWRTERYLSAWKRYASVAEEFPMFEDVLKYARSRSKLAYVMFLRQAAEQERISQQGSWKQLFDWL